MKLLLGLLIVLCSANAFATAQSVKFDVAVSFMICTNGDGYDGYDNCVQSGTEPEVLEVSLIESVDGGSFIGSAHLTKRYENYRFSPNLAVTIRNSKICVRMDMSAVDDESGKEHYQAIGAICAPTHGELNEFYGDGGGFIKGNKYVGSNLSLIPHRD
ncbi:MAG: hypothetical protein AB7O96_16420 [Pseudobdellovibrionaceae bacterium]